MSAFGGSTRSRTSACPGLGFGYRWPFAVPRPTFSGRPPQLDECARVVRLYRSGCAQRANGWQGRGCSVGRVGCLELSSIAAGPVLHLVAMPPGRSEIRFLKRSCSTFRVLRSFSTRLPTPRREPGWWYWLAAALRACGDLPWHGEAGLKQWLGVERGGRKPG